jgi:hypothetical protein
LLDNAEASAEGAPAPPRLLVVHWPRGTIRHHFVPSGTGTSSTDSRLLEPFAAVRNEMIALYGLSHQGMSDGGGAPHAARLLFTMTGASSPGTAPTALGGYSCAGGPSWEQIFLKHAPGLARRDANGTIIGGGYASVVADARISSESTALRNVSFSHAKQSVVTTSGATVQANMPIAPTLAPLSLYAHLFSGFMPGDADARRAFAMKKSVLDSALRELARVRELAPASERPRLDAHEETIRKMEADLAARIMGTGGGACALPPAPPARPRDDTGVPPPPSRDELAGTMLMHAGILRAAFTCDIIRVAALGFAFASHDTADDVIADRNFWSGAPPAESSPEYVAYESAADLSAWYNSVMAQIVTQFRDQVDGLDARATLLERTLIPYVTEVPDCGHAPNRMPALVFGGSALGMQGAQFQNFESSARPFNDFWITVAQALFEGSPLEALAPESFVKDGVAPIAGLWARPR